LFSFSQTRSKTGNSKPRVIETIAAALPTKKTGPKKKAVKKTEKAPAAAKPKAKANTSKPRDKTATGKVTKKKAPAKEAKKAVNGAVKKTEKVRD
jgi:hypothetical protein